MSSYLKALIDYRDRAYSDRKMAKYLRLRREVLELTRSLRENYLRSVENANNSRETWKRIRSISRNPKSMPSQLQFSATALNDFFSSVFQKGVLTESSFDSSSLPDHPLCVPAFQVERRLRQLKKGNGGPDGIPFWIYKDNSAMLADPIAHVFNLCFKDGHFPSLLKCANVIPLPKCSKPSQPSDFRPISLLPVLSKVLEKIVLSEWILPYVSLQLDPMQFAYVPGAGRGTVGALTLINHFILKNLDGKSGAVRVLTADFSKAFDKLTYESILSAVFKFNVPERAFFLLKDFYVVVNSVSASPTKPLTGPLSRAACLRVVCWVLFCLPLSLTLFVHCPMRQSWLSLQMISLFCIIFVIPLRISHKLSGLILKIGLVMWVFVLTMINVM